MCGVGSVCVVVVCVCVWVVWVVCGVGGVCVVVVVVCVCAWWWCVCVHVCGVWCGWVKIYLCRVGRCQRRNASVNRVTFNERLNILVLGS